jgi:hypothetical protein
MQGYRKYAPLIISGAQLLLLFAGMQMHSRSGWLISLSLLAALSILAWLAALSRLRAIRDTPTSRIASAAQGYVELTGRGKPYADTAMTSRLRQLPCLWFRYQIEQRQGKNEWKRIDSGESFDSFILQDDSGECEIDPESAEIITDHRDRWHEGDCRYTEWTLLGSDRLYVIGEFRTQSMSVEFDSNAALNALLAEWKQDQPALHARFDLDKNGELDMNEWMLARQAAKREVAKQQRIIQAQPDTHLIGLPRDGKLFLISNLSQEKLSRRYLIWAWVHVMIFFGALAALGLQNLS